MAILLARIVALILDAGIVVIDLGVFVIADGHALAERALIAQFGFRASSRSLSTMRS
jgi:hypothetical protein